MSEKTVISCDAIDCIYEYEHDGGDFLLGDIKGWLYDEINEMHYCPNCTAIIVKNGEIEDMQSAIIIGQ